MNAPLNNSSMKTVVETFIIEETQELIYDNEKLEQWNKYVDQLGLKGQTKICKPEKSPIPYLHMKSTLSLAFQQLCPRKVDIKDYDKTPIPVEILDLVAMSINEHHFSKIEIWYDDKTPDPVCVGKVGHWYVYDSSYSRMPKGTNYSKFTTKEEAEEYKTLNGGYSVSFSPEGEYLIGRWADVKMSLDAIIEKAKVLYKKANTDLINKKIKEAQRELADLEHRANELFGFTDRQEDVELAF